MIFYNFCYYFWGQHCWWTETNIIGNDFCFFYVSIALNCFTAPSALPLLRCPWICKLCQQTSPKRWLANVKMTSYCDVTNSVYPATMATIGHCSILEFGRGASNQAVAPGITRPLHTTGCAKPLLKSTDLISCRTILSDPSSRIQLTWSTSKGYSIHQAEHRRISSYE